MTGFAGHYRDLLRQARRHSRRPDEAEDLLQTVLVAALEAGRADLDQPVNRRWISGALRLRAAHEARGALRRRQRETAMPVHEAEPAAPADATALIGQMPHSLRPVTLLALSGHSRPEIAALLRINDTALRQRVAAIRLRLRGSGLPPGAGPRGPLPFGVIRRALLPILAQAPAHLGSHDPDGHLFVIGRQSAPHKIPGPGN